MITRFVHWQHWLLSMIPFFLATLPIGFAQSPEPSTAVVLAEKENHSRMLKRLSELDRQSASVPRHGEGRLESAKQEFEQARATGNLVGLLKSIHDMGREFTYAGKPDKGLEVLAYSDIVLSNVADQVPPGFVHDFEVKFYLAKGIAALRKAEDENCVLCQDGEGCLFPIRGKGVHTKKEGSTLAVEYFQETLKRDPKNLTAAWLLNIAQMTLGNFPAAVPEAYRIQPERLASKIEFPRFRNISHQLSLDTLSLSGGVIVDDFDGDRDLDIVVSDWHTTGQLRFFRNQSNGKFSDATNEANLKGIYGGLNLKQADFDNDGDVDILVLRGAWLRDHGKHPNSLLRNDGTGKFVDVSYGAGIAGEGLDFPTQTAAWGDYDKDGDLDLLVGNEEHPCQLFENNGDGSFDDVAAKRGITSAAFTKGVAWGDIDEDGYPELYISNYMQPNTLLKNEAGQRFVDVTESARVAGPKASFAVWFWDYNNDGHLDLYCPAYLEDVKYVAKDYLGVPEEAQKDSSNEGSDALYQGDGSGRFIDVSQDSGLVYKTQTMGCNFGDLNNDGFLDMYLGTGYPGFEGVMPNAMYLNQQGKTFVDVSIAGGFAHLQKGHAIAFADFDHDGDQDVFAELGGAYPGDAFQNALFENPGFDNHWIKLQLVGKESNRFGIGAKIQLAFHEAGSARVVYHWVGNGSSFGSNPMRQEIGVGKATIIDEIHVTWPTSGHTQTLTNVEVDQFIEITEFNTTSKRIDISPIPFDTD